MARSEKRYGWNRCPEKDCDYCVQGKARTPWHRRQRHIVKYNIKRGAWWLI